MPWDGPGTFRLSTRSLEMTGQQSLGLVDHQPIVESLGLEDHQTLVDYQTLWTVAVKHVVVTRIKMCDESQIYELVTKHFLACCSKDAVGHQTKVG